nr:uncharacterized protein LOC117227981 isoform X1 [Megalopta genalis]
MPQMMIEAFAKSLIEKIMQEVFDGMGDRDEKSRMESQEDLTNIQTQTTIRMNDCSHNEQETLEHIEIMMRGLKNLHIGDSTSVPSFLTNLEKQVKHVVHNIDYSTSTAEETKAAETPRDTQGQGDMYQIIHNAVVETPTDPTCVQRDEENCESNEITRTSDSVLHRMIEELETRIEDTDVVKETECDSIGAEDVAAASETEKQFVAIEEITASPLPDQTDSVMDLAYGVGEKSAAMKPEKLRKKGVFSRIRKMLRSIFGGRKN